MCLVCLWNKGGASLMAKAAMTSHALVVHSLAVIQFNGSGGSRKDKNLKAGVALCVRATTLGHVDAMRELGHCLQDGYGVVRNIHECRRLLLEANAREAAAAVAASPRSFMESAMQFSGSGARAGCMQRHPAALLNNKAETLQLRRRQNGVEEVCVGEGVEWQTMYRLFQGGSCSLLSDFGCNVPPAKLHIANVFLVDWFAMHPLMEGLRLCSHANCGRPETRRHEFRRCSACGSVNYCSRACQEALDWKIRHKYDCNPVAEWGDREDNDFEEDDQMLFEEVVGNMST